VVVYLDSSAIVKLVRPEPETYDLFERLQAWEQRVSSVIALVEVPRAIRRTASTPTMVRRMENVLGRIAFIDLDATIRSRAALLEPVSVRTLDAVHIATVLDLGGDLESMVTYDERQAAAARDSGIEVLSPGR
jgi:hypothetical protein